MSTTCPYWRFNEEQDTPLDTLADRANFADDEDKHSIISIGRKHLSDYVKGRAYMFYHWKNFSYEKVWGDIDILTFDDPLMFETAKMYFIKGDDLEKIIRDGSTLILESIQPTHAGTKIIDVLKHYTEE
jgi:hypothetical protein